MLWFFISLGALLAGTVYMFVVYSSGWVKTYREWMVWAGVGAAALQALGMLSLLVWFLVAVILWL